MVEDVLAETARRLEEDRITSTEDVRTANHVMIIIGDVVGDGRALGLQRGEGAKAQIPVRLSARAIGPHHRPGRFIQPMRALAHDLGHPPFAHAGEDELVVQMADHGGFDQIGRAHV